MTDDSPVRPVLLAAVLAAIPIAALVGCDSAVVDPPDRTAADEEYDGGMGAGYDEGLSDAPPPFNPDLDDEVRDGVAEGWKPGDNVNPRADESFAIDKAALEGQEPVEGGDLNAFFPDEDALQDDGYDLVFKQEKDGFAMASLQKDGDELAQLSLTDLRSNPSAVDKFKASRDRIGGFPSVVVGSKGTAVLVGGRYQAQVRERTDLGLRERAKMLERFDLSGLADLDAD